MPRKRPENGSPFDSSSSNANSSEAHSSKFGTYRPGPYKNGLSQARPSSPKRLKSGSDDTDMSAANSGTTMPRWARNLLEYHQAQSEYILNNIKKRAKFAINEEKKTIDKLEKILAYLDELKSQKEKKKN